MLAIASKTTLAQTLTSSFPRQYFSFEDIRLGGVKTQAPLMEETISVEHLNKRKLFVLRNRMTPAKRNLL